MRTEITDREGDTLEIEAEGDSFLITAWIGNELGAVIDLAPPKVAQLRAACDAFLAAQPH